MEGTPEDHQAFQRDLEKVGSLVCKQCGAFPSHDQDVNEIKHTGLLRCSRCLWAMYCSVEHQHLDWASHKSTCKLISSARTRGESLSETLAHLALPSKPQRAQFGQQMIPGAQLGPLPPTTKTVPLESAWPLFAVIASSARARSLFPVPEAIQRQIERVETLKDGSALVVMGKEHQMGAGGMKAWFPSAASEKVASRLFRRVTSDGWSAETALGIALGIREAMYEKRGVGLSYQGEPLTDFGVCAGSVRVTSQDRIAYQRPSGQILPGDDPTDHYFLYYTIASGESTFVDLNLFIFNFRLIVNPQFYAPPSVPSGLPSPGFSFGRISAVGAIPNMHTERDGKSRCSLARWTKARDLTKACTEQGVSKEGGVLLEEVHELLRAGRKKEAPAGMIAVAVRGFSREAETILGEALDSGRIARFPSMPQLGMMDESPL